MNSKYSVVDDKGLSFLNLGTMLEYYKVTSVDYLEKVTKGYLYQKFCQSRPSSTHIDYTEMLLEVTLKTSMLCVLYTKLINMNI